MAGALRGAGDTRFPSITGAAGTWGAVLLAWLSTGIPRLGLPGVWAAFLFTTPVTSYLTWRRLQSRISRLTAGD